MLHTLLPIAVGAISGALLRWLLGTLFAAGSWLFSPAILAANWIGAFAIGICAEWIQHPQWRLLLITGFLGSLTTFSGFSLEIVNLMQSQRWGAAFLSAALHLGGSIVLTAAGIWLVQQFK
ncbi:fluoride efflux transporter CrcB [Neisseria animalis]|uniref:Fluoride-specific ion channel FluC n=1 Tax=Neisseria animalis TaxID=492 RepID=A0A5P3MSX8_NEIAN|nr:fluoride efflux transporter CrcB [Neisseria animalis]QEY24712.1 fluoride efflux transporter CrcB [Neisseria animalis]ROW31694.1 fluoride efflux transporter CrcB [Neisseria animalis]VEE07884.1 camphor resistance protein CrcB [Neisseria animalis]